MILYSALMPHPPIMIPEIGGENIEQVQQSIIAAKEIAEKISEEKPETILVITPHGSVFSDAIAVYTDERLEGDLRNFDAKHIGIKVENDIELASKIIAAARDAGIPAVGLNKGLAQAYGATTRLDHGIIVPLYYINQAWQEFKLVPVAIGMLSYESLYSFGKLIQDVSEKLNRRTVILISGDMSHCLTEDAPGGYNEAGADFDLKIVETLKDYTPATLFELDKTMVQNAGECGLRPLIMGLGTLDGKQVESRIFSYEGPFGVGYLVAGLKNTGNSRDGSMVEKIFLRRQERLKNIREKESLPVQIARQTVENYVRDAKEISVPREIPDYLREKAGVFVSLKKDGDLRGCIGTIEPTRDSIAEEIIQNAISASTQDPRFEPVDEDELDEITYSVDILGKAEKISSMAELDPQRYGVIVRKGRRSGLLLPRLEGIDSVDEQVAIAKKKAGISPLDSDVELERFEVVRYY